MATTALTGVSVPFTGGILNADSSGATDTVLLGQPVTYTAGTPVVSAGTRLESHAVTFTAGQLSVLPASTKVQFLIGGTDRTTKVFRSGVTTISETIDGGGSMNFPLVDPTYSYRPSIGEPVEFWLNGIKEFAGIVKTVNEGHAPFSDPKSPVGRPTVVCGDPASRFSDLYVFREFAATVTPREMWQAIIDEILAVEGYSLASGSDPGVIDDRLFQGVTVADFSQRVNRASGWDSCVDYDKIIHFFDPAVGVEAAPVSVADNDGQIRGPLTREFEGAFANVVHVRLSVPSGSLFTEFAVKAPGVSGASWGPWLLRQPITENAAITGIAVGAISTVDPVLIITQAEYDRRLAANQYNTGLWHFKYAPDTNVLEQNTKSPNFFLGAIGYIGSPVSLSISYANGEVANAIVTVQDDTSIAARAAIEGGSGRHEYMEELNNVETIAAGEAIANGLLDRKASIPKEFSFASDIAGWKAGQQLISTYTKPSATGTFLIQSVTKSSIGPSLEPSIFATPFMRSQINSINGPMVESEAEMNRRRIDRDRPSRPLQSHRHPFILAGSITGRTNNGLDSLVVPSGGGTVTTSGLTITGADTTFQTDFASGDFVFVTDPFEPQLRIVDVITSDTSMTVTSVFSPDLTDKVYRKPFEWQTKSQILQDGPILAVAVVMNEPPTGANDATGDRRLVLDVQKNTVAAPSVYTSIIPGVLKLIMPTGTGANVEKKVRINANGLRGEVLRLIVLDAHSDTAIRDGVCVAHQYVGK